MGGLQPVMLGLGLYKVEKNDISDLKFGEFYLGYKHILHYFCLNAGK